MKQDNEDYSVENFYATAAYDFVKFTLKVLQSFSISFSK